MTFDLPTVSGLVARAACELLPGWKVTTEIVQSVDAIGALACVLAIPERKIAHVKVAPHPPGEDMWETICHEMTHGVLSPLTQLIEYSPAVVMLEEQIVELLGNVIARGGVMAQAVTRALRKPRTPSPVIRKRISALATRRRNEGKGRTMADGSRLAELAMKAGEMGAREDVPEDVRALLAEFVAELAGGGGPASSPAPPMREEEPGKPDPAMREDDVPPAMREQFRVMKRTAAMSLESSMRLRLFELRTVDKLEITPAIEARLRKAKTPEDFEERLELVKTSLGVGAEVRKRSSVVPDESKGGVALKFDDLIKEGIPAQQARDLVELSAKNRAAADAELSGARIRLRQMGGAK
jgi:hypothetical protein